MLDPSPPSHHAAAASAVAETQFSITGMLSKYLTLPLQQQRPESELVRDADNCQRILQQCEMFQKVHPTHIGTLAGLMKTRILEKNEILLEQDAESDRFFLLDSGDIRRSRVDPLNAKSHTVEFAIKAQSINSMKVISGDPVYATVKCMSDSCKVYEMKRTDFLNCLTEHPQIATQIAAGLCEEIRRGSRKFATPLLEQQQQDVNMPAVSIAAGIESYYRSALNAKLNARLTGVKAELFPNMHIQVPSRIAYITGFKGLRAHFDHTVDPDVASHPSLVRLGTAIAPGIIMTPISSVLEASNAGHMNSESMSRRWMRGVVPRAGREIIFGVGLNQLSDYFEERMIPFVGTDQQMAANAAGSLVAGVVSGYLSHVPHNMSTLKLLEPSSSYGQLFQSFVDKSVPPVVDRLVEGWSPSARTMTRAMFATLMPRGVMIRTTQIVGSFMILNGTINYLQLREHYKIQRAISGAH